MKEKNLLTLSKELEIAYTTLYTWLEKGSIPELTKPGVCLRLGIPLDKDPLEYIKKIINRVPANDNEIGGVA